ncbi:MAG: FIST C-terminal domain-containing protein [Anaerolineaceae bacterium]|nr:FIST C-terminal domain-containing protein [Anaerolineaceae bacterium]
MRRIGVYGVGTGINGRDAAMQATQRALDQVGTSRPVLALVLIAQEFNINEVLAGLTSLLGETPLWGFSTLCPLTNSGDQPRSVVVALLTGSDFQASVNWFPGYVQDSTATARQLAHDLRQDVFLPQHILIAADGINGSLLPVCSALSDLQVSVAGCMAAGDPSMGKTFQLGKNQAGPGGLAAARLGGRFRVGVGMAQGWHDLGVYFHATRTRDVWLQTLDGVSAAETYARLFGYAPREWAFPPLTDMARLYPLGVEVPTEGDVQAFVQTDPANLLIRSALRVEVDGSLRMSAPVPEGAVVHLMSGDPDTCLRAARSAARQALDSLEKGARPILALVLVDAAWQLLFESRPKALAEAISVELKTAYTDFPLVGAYTFGQLIRPALDQAPILHNQNLAVLVIAEAQE